MSEFNQPATPGIGPEALPTPALDTPASPNEGTTGLPTPALPEQSLSSPSFVLTPETDGRICPVGYRQARVQNDQSFTDLLLENDVSYNALRSANPNLPVTNLMPGTVYCAPPGGSRKLCSNGNRNYILEDGESLSSLSRSLGISVGRLLLANPTLAPSDFIPGRVICLP